MKPMDFRKGSFRSKRADRVKLIFWDGTGLCLLCKRLEDGKFRWIVLNRPGFAGGSNS